MSVTGKERSTGSARMKRFSSARQRPQTSLVRPFTASRPRRPYSAYTDRGSEETGPKYDAPETTREWWRHYVKETPTPGSYQHKGFLEDLHSQTNTYGFRNTGRRPTSARFYTSGEILLPGAYEHADFLDDVTRKPKTYNFRSTEREAGPKIGHGYGDKELDTSPAWFDLRVVDTNEIEKEKNMKDANYRSHVRRKIESNHQFKIVEGPGPGLYDSVNVTRPTSASISSSFKSKVPRFHGRPHRVPGPGTYNTSTSVFGEPKPLPAISHHFKKKTGIAMS